MKKRGRKHLIANKRVASPLRIDPTRTITLRRHMLAQVRRRFALLRGRIISLVVDEDAFGLKATVNADQSRDELGRFTATGYHGTASEFTAFKTNEPTTPGGKDLKGIYFSGDQRSAGSYARMAKKRGGVGRERVIAAELIMDNPLDITKSIAKYRKKGMSFGVAKRKALGDLKPEHDGVVFKGNTQNPPEYIIFDPSKAKVIKPTANQFNPDQLRGPDGKWLGHDSPTTIFFSGDQGPRHEVQPHELLRHTIGEALKGIRAKIGGNLTKYIDKAPGGKFVRSKLASLNAKLKDRYGEKTMGRILLAANVTSWSITIGTAAMGAPITVPAAGLTLAGVALAEAHLQVTRGLRRVGVINEGDVWIDGVLFVNNEWLDGNEVQVEAEKLVRELIEAGHDGSGNYYIPVTDIRGHDEGARSREPITDPDSVPPLTVGPDSYLVDGHHRLAGLKAGGSKWARVRFGHLPTSPQENVGAPTGNTDQPRDELGRFAGVRSVFHETNHDYADIIVTQGIRPDFKRERNITEFGPGAGIDRGAYVAEEGAFSKGSFGKVRVYMDIHEDQLDVPTEAKQLGYEKGREVAGQQSLDYALKNENGAVTTGEVHPSAIKRIEVYEGSKWISKSPEEYKSERGISDIPRLPSMAYYEKTLRDNADRWSLSERSIQQSITDYNRASLSDKHYLAQDAGLVGNVKVTNRFQFATSADKLRQFQDWLRQQYAQTVTSPTDEQLWRTYIDAGYRKGAGRAFDDAKAKPRAAAASAPFSPGEDSNSRFAGTRDEFLRSTFAQPVSRERVELLASRTFNDLENVTDDLSARLGRSLADGLTQGQSPRELAREMSTDLDISQGRAELIARTEIIRAHADGQLDSLKNMGVDEVGVQVEWLSTNDGRQCEDCASREGATLTIDEARGLIPFHPNAVFAGSTFETYGECLEFVRAWYSGPSIILITTRNHSTTIGPNHPMMTKRGMVKAAELKEGDEVLRDLRCKNSTGPFESHEGNLKQAPLVENEFESCASVPNTPCIANSASDLHGDRQFCQGEVEAIRPARGLLVVRDSGGIEKFREGYFVRTDTDPVVVPVDRPSSLSVGSVNLSSPCRVSSSDARIDADSWFVWEKIHSVTSSHFEGYAYDCTTLTSLYCSDGFVVSNCRCCWIPSVPDPTDNRRHYVTVNFNPDQPRDEHGRFTSGGSDLLHAKLDAAHHLSDEHREKSRAALHYVLGKIPAAAHARLTDHLVDVQFHSTPAELTQAMAATSPKVKWAMDRGSTVNGVYRQQAKTLVLDGDVPRRVADDVWKKDRSNVHETYAHEITHAIDGPGFPLSGSKEWTDAWQREIGFIKPASGTARLSVYATSATHEGFAEFGRLVYGTNTDRAAIEKKFPLCTAYWKSQGLWQ